MALDLKRTLQGFIPMTQAPEGLEANIGVRWVHQKAWVEYRLIFPLGSTLDWQASDYDES